MVAKPTAFTPEGAPVGVECRFVTFLADRVRITPRSIFVHTNGAGGEGSIQSAWNWAHSRPNQNTCPHYQVDRSGVARKMLPSNRKGIANATVAAYQEGRGSIANWSLAIETADTGYRDDPGISDFTAAQAETIAQIIAYESMVWNFPLDIISTWYGAGVASHTDPFGYPYTTLHRGKICPGLKKKASVRQFILPRARELVAEWAGATPPPPAPAPPPPAPPGYEEDDLYIDHLVLDSVDTAPPVDLFNGGHASDWLQVAVTKAMLKQLTGSGEYTQATAEKLNELLAAS